MASNDKFGLGPLQIIALGVAFLLVAVLSALSWGQDARVLADIQNRALMDEAEWNVAKKLSPVPLKFNGKPAGGDTPIDSVQENEWYDLHFWQFTLLDVIDANNCTLIHAGKVIWLADYPTKGLATDDKVYLASKIKWDGMKEYLSLSGKKQVVRRFVFVSPAELEKESQRLAAEQEAKDYPEWHSTAGTTVRAKFIGGSLGQAGIQLETKDGKRLTVHISKFTEDDQKKLRELVKEYRAKK